MAGWGMEPKAGACTKPWLGLILSITQKKKKLSGKNIWEENNGLTLEIQSRRGAGNGGVRVQKHTSFKDPFHYEVVLTF